MTLANDTSGIAGISSMATRHVLGELAASYRARTGQVVSIESVGGVEAARRLESGESFDFAVLAKDAMLRLADAGFIDAATLVDVAQSGVAIAVVAGASRPELGSEDAVRRAVENARAIGYSTGPSGTHLMTLLERWGIAEQVTPRLVRAPAGVPVASLLTTGEVELGFQQLSELINVDGISIVGELPAEIQRETVFAAGICSQSASAPAVLSWLSSLRSDEAGVVKRRHGMV
ncbi:ABC transporter substrate-binding protein [Paraburkholderia sp. Ac-20340]|nr:ABC transporter substrate-binding protein [Paraburkholderia sp. Ac-20340]